MSKPKYIQLQRTGGWRKPENTVVVSRPSKYGNPYRVGCLYPMKLCESFGEPIDEQLFRAMPINLVLKHSCNALIDTAEEAVLLYKIYIEFVQAHKPEEWAQMLHELKGKNLACWCKADKKTPCHAKILLEKINGII